MAKRERQLPLSFNNDKDVKRVRDYIAKLSDKDQRLFAAAVDHSITQRATPFRSKAGDNKEAMAGFLDKISFDYFCTFTTRKPVSLFATRRIAEKVCERVDAGNSTSVFWASEEFDVRDGFHFHALMKFAVPQKIVGYRHRTIANATLPAWDVLRSQELHKMELFDWYYRKYGRCQIIDNREPMRQLAASYYISKYVTKRITDYDFRISKQHML